VVTLSHAPEQRWISKEISMTRTIVTVITASLALIVSACNTVEGAGKDLQSAGSAVEGAAK